MAYQKKDVNVLLDSLPHPAMLINNKKIVLAANKSAIDITQRKKAEQILEQSRIKLLNILKEVKPLNQQLNRPMKYLIVWLF